VFILSWRRSQKKILIFGSTQDFHIHNIGFGAGSKGARTWYTLLLDYIFLLSVRNQES
jgi:hypothetical protein